MTFEELNSMIIGLSAIENIDFFTIGKSLFNQDIYGVHLGSYEGGQLFMEGGIHAREYPSTLFLIDEIKYLATQEFVGGIYIIPLSNPDGVRLVLDGVDWVDCERQRNYLLNLNNNITDFSDWKANGNGVDLNVNFDASWGEGKLNQFCPNFENFVGWYANSERETRVLEDFLNTIKPNISISWHTKGNIIYYGFESLSQEDLKRDEAIGETLSSVNGYPIIKTEGSVAGLSDWVSLNLNVPAYTIELYSFETIFPPAMEQQAQIFEKNKDVPLVAIDQV